MPNLEIIFMNKKKESTFKYGYFVYVFALVFFALFSIVYVKTLLNEYESSQPDRIVEAEIDKMISLAKADRILDHLHTAHLL